MTANSIIIPVASGKGGVGKTLLSVNLGYALAELGKRVTIIDLDFGGANLHTCMGYETAPDGIGNFLNQRSKELSEYSLSTTNKNLSIIPGDAEMVGIADITSAQKTKLMNAIKDLKSEYVILDLGAGSSYNTIDFFAISPFGIIVAMPELTSILNAYAFLKNTIFRALYLEFKDNLDVKALFKKQIKKGGEEAWKVSDLMDKIFDIDPDLQTKAANIVDNFTPKIVINMATAPTDMDLGEKLRKIASSYLSMEMEYLGFLYRDSNVHTSIVARSPLAVMANSDQTYQTIVRMAYKIINAKRTPQLLLDVEDYDDSYEIVLDEASEDMIGIMGSYNDLAGENLVTVTELLSALKNLEYENLNLKKENNALKRRILASGKKI